MAVFMLISRQEKNTLLFNVDKINLKSETMTKSVFRWLNTVSDTRVSFTYFCKTLDSQVVKNCGKEK